MVPKTLKKLKKNEKKRVFSTEDNRTARFLNSFCFKKLNLCGLCNEK